MKNRLATVKKSWLLAIGALGLALVFLAYFTEKTQQVTIVNASCSIPGSDTFARVFPGTVTVKNADGNLSTLRFPISGYEGSTMNVINAQGEPIDTWYSYYFCNPDQTFGEYVQGTYSPDKPIHVTSNYFGRITYWQLVD